MIRKSGNRFSEKIMLNKIEHDPEKWEPVFRKDHAQLKCWSANRFNYETLRSSAVRRQSRHG